MFNQAAAEVVTPEQMKKLLEQLIKDACTGNTKAAQILLDRLLGKTPQPVQVAGDNGGPIEIIVTYGSNTK